jgi:uncharacterized NAD(P)/FAD-binding protein YdhS
MANGQDRVVVVGGGASGVLAAVNLSRALKGLGEIVLIEQNGRPGRGIAYGTEDPGHLLNVRVANMSAFPDDPEHFFRWLNERGSALSTGCATPFCFVPRKVYGAYLADLFGAALTDNVRSVTGSAVAIARRGSTVTVRLANGSALDATAVVLATGHEAKPAEEGGIVSAWAPGAIDNLPPDADVAILGTGLTMVDVVLSLLRAGHRGRILAVSRRGLMPKPHAPATATPLAAADVPFGAPASQLLRWMRGRATAAPGQGSDWRGSLDALRPHTRALWQAMSPDDRARFLRHARPWWDVHRHRMAPAVAETIAGLTAEGRLRLVAAKVVAAEDGGLALRRRGSTAIERVPVDRFGLGLDLAEDFALLDAHGRAANPIYAIGPLGRGSFWEITAIPDIRQQCAELADDFVRRAQAVRARHIA